MLENDCSVNTEKYRRELIEILEELIDYKPSLKAHIGVTRLFSWRAIFDFSSDAWDQCSVEDRITIINALAEKRTLFVALMTFKAMYIEMNRPDIASAAGLSLACFLEDIIVDTEYSMPYENYDNSVNDSLY